MQSDRMDPTSARYDKRFCARDECRRGSQLRIQIKYNSSWDGLQQAGGGGQIIGAKIYPSDEKCSVFLTLHSVQAARHQSMISPRFLGLTDNFFPGPTRSLTLDVTWEHATQSVYAHTVLVDERGARVGPLFFLRVDYWYCPDRQSSLCLLLRQISAAKTGNFGWSVQKIWKIHTFVAQLGLNLGAMYHVELGKRSIYCPTYSIKVPEAGGI